MCKILTLKINICIGLVLVIYRSNYEDHDVTVISPDSLMIDLVQNILLNILTRFYFSRLICCGEIKGDAKLHPPLQ